MRGSQKAKEEMERQRMEKEELIRRQRAQEEAIARQLQDQALRTKDIEAYEAERRREHQRYFMEENKKVVCFGLVWNGRSFV